MTAVTRAGKLLAWVLPGLPGLPLGVAVRLLAVHPADLQRQAGDVLGLGAALCLLACLAVTPVATATGMRQAAEPRQWYGLWVFVLGAAGLVIAAAGGVRGCTGTVQQWTGTLIVVLLAPAAVTSNQLAQKLLGRYWKTWQRRLTWTAWAVLAVHLLLLSAWVTAAFTLASVPLLAARVPGTRGQLARFRRTRFRQPRVMRALMPAALLAFATGMTALSVLEVGACARAL